MARTKTAGTFHEPKGYIYTDEGLCFSVLLDYMEVDRVLCWLRYRRTEQGLQKISEEAASELLSQHYPKYLWHCRRADVLLHGVPMDSITEYRNPRRDLRKVLQDGKHDPKLQCLNKLLSLLAQWQIRYADLGITGSLLIGAQGPDSDIDLLVYGRGCFQNTLQALAALRDSGQLEDLTQPQWERVWSRRQCELNLEEYMWHEQRKGNKYMLDGTCIDVSLQTLPWERFKDEHAWRKCGSMKVRARLRDDWHAYDCPSRYDLDHDEIDSVVSYTATYTAQARKGELIDAQGQVERNKLGRKRLVVGTSRAAHEEFIRVVRE